MYSLSLLYQTLELLCGGAVGATMGVGIDDGMNPVARVYNDAASSTAAAGELLGNGDDDAVPGALIYSDMLLLLRNGRGAPWWH